MHLFDFVQRQAYARVHSHTVTRRISWSLCKIDDANVFRFASTQKPWVLYTDLMLAAATQPVQHVT